MVMRKNTGWMDGFYGLPAGKVEYGETYAQAAVREAKEEAGVDIKVNDLKFVHIVHRHAQKDGLFMDWVDVFFETDKWVGEPYNAEKEKSESLDWVNIDKDSDMIVPPQLSALKNIANDSNYSEFGW